MSTTIKIKKDNRTIWTGRVINESEDFAKRRKFSCEGALCFLNDTLQELVYYDNYTITAFITALINIHNNKVPNNRQFLIGTISVEDSKNGFEYKTEYKNTLESLNDNLFSRLVGHVRIRYANNSDTPIIDYLADYPNVSSQDINFGDNLLDFTKNWDLANLTTVVYPRGKQLDEENSHGDKEYLTIASVNGGIKYLESTEAVNAFGRIERIVDFNEIDSPITLLNLGMVYLASLQFDDMVLSVSAIDLHMLNPEIVSFELLDQVKCYSAPHGLNRIFPITQIDIPLDAPENVKYTMGSSEKSDLTSKSVKTSKAIQNEIANSTDNLLSDAKHQATALINQKTTGYVNIITEQETSQALIISDKPDLENATKMWRWNLNGLGYWNKADDPTGDYTLAITNNGVIVADFIKAGVISDGAHRNYWNMATGELRISFNSELAGGQGTNLTVRDLVNVSQRGYDIANEANSKQYGSNNLLNGSSLLQLGYDIGDYWGTGCWVHGAGNSPAAIEDITDAPNGKIKKCYHVYASRGGNGSEIVQKDVFAYPNTVYTMSCYAKGIGTLHVQAGHEFNNGNKVFIGKSGEVNDDTKWRRYYFTFKTGANNSVYAEDAAGIYDNRIDVYFGVTSGLVQLCGFQLERGNAPTDWQESGWDTEQTANEYTETYATTLADAERQFTNDQLQALDESFEQEKLLKRLTNGFVNTGLYIVNNQLLMNASFIRSGAIDAGIIQAGILTDRTKSNMWNLSTGYFKASRIEASGIHATGVFTAEASWDWRATFSAGAILSYNSRAVNAHPNSWINFFDSLPGNKSGLEMGSYGGLTFKLPELYVSNRAYGGTRYKAWTGKLDYKVVSDVSLAGSRFRKTTSPHGIECVNGIVICAW